MAPGTFPSRALRRRLPRCKQKRGNGLNAAPLAVRAWNAAPPGGRRMQIGVYGSGYLGTVISACLADFGTPVSCCHADSSRMVEMAQGNVPFFEKNLKEVIRRNVRSGRLLYSTDVESFARKTRVIFLAEDSASHVEDLVLRIARLAAKPPVLAIVTPVPVGTA